MDIQELDFWNELTISEQKEIYKGIDELNQRKRISYESFLKKVYEHVE